MKAYEHWKWDAYKHTQVSWECWRWLMDTDDILNKLCKTGVVYRKGLEISAED